MKVLLFVSLFCCGSLIGLAGEEIKGKIVSVIDGNTIEILTVEKDTIKVLLQGIDSPDPGQHFADQAKKLLENLMLNKSVNIEIKGKDRLGNRIGVIHVEGVPDPRQELVKAGLAWTTEQVADLEELKERAKTQGRGLWSEEHPVPPWLYRRQQSMLQAKSS